MVANREDRPPPLGGGPLGLGDPNDRRLRKTESDVIIPKMMKKEAEKRCSKEMQEFLECAGNAGLSVAWKCRDKNNSLLKCVDVWVQNPDFKNEITEKYIHARNHYRRTGETLLKYTRNPRKKTQNKMSAIPQGAFATFKVKQNLERSTQPNRKQKNIFTTNFQPNEPVFGRPLLKYSKKLMDSIWGFYSRYAVHNLKKNADPGVFGNQPL